MACDLTNFVENKVNQSENEWGKCLKKMPMFTIREIKNHRIRSGKSSSAIMKTADRGERFKEERYLSADDVFAAYTVRIFYVKGKCKASMKREIRSMEVGINKVNCDIIFAKCSCPAGESGYYNHIMALLFEIADHSLHQLISIPEEKACTSMARRWGLPSANSSAKQPIMDIDIRKNSDSKFRPNNISSTFLRSSFSTFSTF